MRYFDSDRKRPGLPLDVAALADSLEPEKVGIQLVNLSASETRRLIVQAGGYGEHNFTTVNFNEVILDYEGGQPWPARARCTAMRRGQHRGRGQAFRGGTAPHDLNSPRLRPGATRQ